MHSLVEIIICALAKEASIASGATSMTPASLDGDCSYRPVANSFRPAFAPLPKVALKVPATELTSVQVQWRAGDPTAGTDQNALPLALSIEASADGGKEWHGITGGDEAVDLALAHKASPRSSQHRYPVSLLALRRKR